MGSHDERTILILNVDVAIKMTQIRVCADESVVKTDGQKKAIDLETTGGRSRLQVATMRHSLCGSTYA
jgi:hypothetical protein